MPRKDPRITAYLAAAPPFARPILREIRAAMHAGCPSVEETIKWGMPAFVHRGLLGGMAAFKAHAALWFWRGRHVPGLDAGKVGAMGQFGRLTSLADLPPRAALVRLVRGAARLNESLKEAPKAAATSRSSDKAPVPAKAPRSVPGSPRSRPPPRGLSAPPAPTGGRSGQPRPAASRRARRTA